MNERIIFMGVYLLSVFVSSVSQVLLKKSADSKHKTRLAEYLNWRVILAYSLFIAATMITVLALRYIPVSLGVILESSGYIFVTILGVLFLKERVSRRKVVGLMIILCGIIIYTL